MTVFLLSCGSITVDRSNSNETNQKCTGEILDYIIIDGKHDILFKSCGFKYVAICTTTGERRVETPIG